MCRSKKEITNIYEMAKLAVEWQHQQTSIDATNGSQCMVSDKQRWYLSLQVGIQGKYPDAQQQGTIAWDDARIGVKWPIKKPKLSKRDKQVHGSTDRL